MIIIIIIIIIMNVYCLTAGSTAKRSTNTANDGQSMLSAKGSTHHVRSNIISSSSSSSSSAKATSSSKGSSSINSPLPQAKQHQHQHQPSSQLWGGMWVPRIVTNSLRSNYWLPNDVFASSHISLGVQLTTEDSLLNTQWDG